MKAKEVYIAGQAIKALASEKLPIKAAYSVSKLAKKLDAEFTEIEKLRTDLVKKYGTEDAAGVWTIAHDSSEMQEYVKEFTSFLEETEVTDEFPKLNIDQFGEITVSPDLMAALFPFIQSD